SGKKEKFLPLKNKKVNLFVCGPTVYDFAHLGHARTCVIFDSFAKYLRQIGFNVFYLQNITDLDDKIIARAREKGVLPKKLASVFEKEYLKSMKSLGINSVTKYAKATSYIKKIISQIEILLKKGYAYKLDDGIYYPNPAGLANLAKEGLAGTLRILQSQRVFLERNTIFTEEAEILYFLTMKQKFHKWKQFLERDHL
ncbi:MAG: class I tRNA ligase family protein, partial [Candidatus Staskawiczbacteria bacterium]|nr:class I tRNA ligase family protein [Candidatus Staskawiczbacteria bacterium]